MRIEIDHKVISSSPREDIICTDDNDKIIQLKQSVLSSSHTAVLVSGYRGTGKTSFLYKLRSEISSDSRSLFIHINITKFEKYSVILRRLIREIYLNITDKKINIKDNLKKSIELLYARTFNEVVFGKNFSLSQQVDREADFKISNLNRFIISIATLLLSTFNWKLDIGSILVGNINIVLFIMSIAWVAFELISMGVSIKKKKVSSSEISSKSLYDDDIAETQLRYILKGLNEENIKVVIVIDELDKLEDDNEVKALLTDMKPIILSDLASFIIVSGQRLFYELSSSYAKDDSIISSLFSKLIHIRLLNKIEFSKLFDGMLVTKGSNEDILKYYLDSLILNSNRIIRTFLNQIGQSIVWIDNKAFLEIKDDDSDIYRTDSKLLNIVDSIVHNEIDNQNYTNGIRDLYIIQLHIWIQRLKLKGKYSFAVKDILEFEGEYLSIYPIWCSSQFPSLCNKLMDCLLEENMLEEEQKEVDGASISCYKWSNKAAIKDEDIWLTNQDKVKSDFLMKMIEIEKYLRNICSVLFSDYDSSKLRSVKQAIDFLIDRKVLRKDTINYWKLQSIINVSNKIRHGNFVEKESYYMISDESFITDLKHTIINEYIVYVFQRILEEYNYFLRDAYYMQEFSIFSSKNLSHRDILLEVKSNVPDISTGINAIMKIIEYYKEYNKNQEKVPIMFLVFFTSNNNQFIRLKKAIDEYIVTRYLPMYDNFRMLSISEDFDYNEIEDVLLNIANKENYSID